MQQISNQTLAFLLVLAVIISLGGTFLSLNKLDRLTRGAPLTGFAGSNTTIGAINLTVFDITEINFTAANISWGSGTVNETSNNCTLTTKSAEDLGCKGFTKVSAPLTLQNIGNNNVELNLSFNATAAQFIGGTSTIRKFQFQMSNNTDPGCDGRLENRTFSEVSTADASNDTVCTNFTYAASKDKINIDINITIPQDAPFGLKSATITALGKTV